MSTFQGQPGASNGNGTHHDTRAGFGQRIDHLGDSAQTLWTEARGAVSDFTGKIDIQGRLERRPYSTLAAAVGIGYVLGGGLFTPLTARIVRLGIRLAALPFVKDELIGMAEAAVDNISRGTSSVPGGTVDPSRPSGGV